MATTKAGLEDVIAANSAICDIIGAQGKLTYRGIDIHDLARNSSFEETTYLLWFGSLPTRDALLKFSAELASHRVLPNQVLTLMKDFPRTATPMDALRTALSALAFYDPQAHDAAREANIAKAMRVTAQTATHHASRSTSPNAWRPIKRSQASATASTAPRTRARRTCERCHVSSVSTSAIFAGTRFRASSKRSSCSRSTSTPTWTFTRPPATSRWASRSTCSRRSSPSAGLPAGRRTCSSSTVTTGSSGHEPSTWGRRTLPTSRSSAGSRPPADDLLPRLRGG